MSINYGNWTDDDLLEFIRIIDSPSAQSFNKIQAVSEYDRRLAKKFGCEVLSDFSQDCSDSVIKLCSEFDLRMLPEMLGEIYSSNFLLDRDFFPEFFYFGSSDKNSIPGINMFSLSDLHSIFSSNQELRDDYEAACNNVMYLVNSIYRYRPTPEYTVERLLEEMDEKKSIVYANNAVAFNYLNSVGRRLVGKTGCDYNLSVSRDTNYDAFVEAVAFGCSLDELNAKNFEGAKKLVYVPRSL